MRYLKLTIQGLVQGVGFRRWFMEQALKLHLTGYVKNIGNGDVEAIIVGTYQDVNDMIKLTMAGPQNSKVKQIFYEDLIEITELDFDSFQIRQ